jgi:hypothetical protein
MPPRTSSRGLLDGSYAINGLRESDRRRERLWGERQGAAVTEIVERHQQPVRASGAVCLVSPGSRARACRVPRSPPQRQIASRADRQEPADIWPRVSSSNTLFRSGTVSPVPHPCLGGAVSRLSASCPREDGRGIQRCGKPIPEAERLALFRGIAGFPPVLRRLCEPMDRRFKRFLLCGILGRRSGCACHALAYLSPGGSMQSRREMRVTGQSFDP